MQGHKQIIEEFLAQRTSQLKQIIGLENPVVQERGLQTYFLRLDDFQNLNIDDLFNNAVKPIARWTYVYEDAQSQPAGTIDVGDINGVLQVTSIGYNSERAGRMAQAAGLLKDFAAAAGTKADLRLLSAPALGSEAIWSAGTAENEQFVLHWSIPRNALTLMNRADLHNRLKNPPSSSVCGLGAP